jgi:hypothetical protein
MYRDDSSSGGMLSPGHPHGGQQAHQYATALPASVATGPTGLTPLPPHHPPPHTATSSHKASKKAASSSAAAAASSAASTAAASAGAVPPLEAEPEYKSVQLSPRVPSWSLLFRHCSHLSSSSCDMCVLRPPRVDLLAHKHALDSLLGSAEVQATYWNLIEKYLMVKLSKKELDQFVIEKLGKNNGE